MDKVPLDAFVPPQHWRFLPPLPYSPADHKAGIAIAWTIIVLNSSALPIALFYGLWYGTSLSKRLVLAIVTATAGVASLAQACRRLWKLLRKDGEYRPLGSRRGWLDFYQIQTMISIAVVATILSVSTSLTPPSITLLSIPISTIVLMASFQLIISHLSPRSPVRISSVPAGSPTRPGVYCIMEDVIAVDASGGVAYREALDKRYQASARFRRMLWRLNWWWGCGGMVVGAVLMGVTVGLRGDGDGTWRIGVGWGVPWGMAALGAWATVRWVKKELLRERDEWTGGMEERTG
ncbi:hypothetical protein MMC26_001339 [Xylographa opegraphella]|nr:hypothetical protein [Xylographa opegraphella]